MRPIAERRAKADFAVRTANFKTVKGCTIPIPSDRSDIRWVSLHAEGGSLEQNGPLQVYSFSAMGSYLESSDLSSQSAEPLTIVRSHFSVEIVVPHLFRRNFR